MDGATAQIKKVTKAGADLFCGGGGTSQGMKEAFAEMGMRLDLVAVNHWKVAIGTHEKNHPEVRHVNKPVDSIDPLKMFPKRTLDILVASPECIGHSRARGGRPTTDQKRADAWDIQRWVEKLNVRRLIIENVPEFEEWGPVGANGKPLKSKKGMFFKAFIAWLEISYKVEWKVLNCADYGDATTRKRFFLMARKDRKTIHWPEKSHFAPIDLAKKQPNLYSTVKPKAWRTAREIIDWSLKGESIFNSDKYQKKPLVPNTMRRLLKGLFRYSLKDFVLNMKATDRRYRGIDLPVPAITAGSSAPFYLCQPSEIDIEAFLVQFYGERKGQEPRVRGIEEPVWTITPQNRMGIAFPEVMFNMSRPGDPNKDETVTYPIDRPLPTQLSKAHLGFLQAEGWVVRFKNNEDGQSVDVPCRSLTSQNAFGLAEAGLDGYIIPQMSGVGPDSADDPMRTIMGSSRGIGFAQPWLLKYYGTSIGQDVDAPVGALTAKERYGLVVPQIGAVIDIFFRMFQPHELAAATSFPKTYVFTGTKTEVVRQIGNAVPVKTAKALVLAAFRN